MRHSIQIRQEEHFEKLLSLAANAGFREVSVSFGSDDLFFRDDYASALLGVAKLLDKYGLQCTQTHLPCYHLLVSSEEVTEETERAIRRAIEGSGELGAAWTAFHPRTAVNQGFDRTLSFRHNREALLGYLEVAERSGCGIGVENMPLYPGSHPEWRFFGGGFEELCELCDSLDSDKIGICWDFGHAHTAALDQPKALLRVGDRLKITHVHDNFRNSDHHQMPLLATNGGGIDWAPVMQSLSAIDYRGPLALELTYPPEDMLEPFVKCGYACLTHLKGLAATPGK
ncbi:MAG: sugar phosphate isomerase/epimerase [Clostridia bacterium]|nr:sugar phosphate isomerase/epimerase [Clostridia bacterium]